MNFFFIHKLFFHSGTSLTQIRDSTFKIWLCYRPFAESSSPLCNIIEMCNIYVPQGYHELRQSLDRERKIMAAAMAPPEPKGGDNDGMDSLIMQQ